MFFSLLLIKEPLKLGQYACVYSKEGFYNCPTISERSLELHMTVMQSVHVVLYLDRC